MTQYNPECRPVLIGSLPQRNHAEAVDLIFNYTPEIPLWPQLPSFKAEGMMMQFLPGLPGVTEKDDKIFVDTSSPDFEMEFLAFYEEYIAVTEGMTDIADSRFVMSDDEASGFGLFLERAEREKDTLFSLKGQVTGPVTFCMGVVDQDGRALFYDDQVRDAAVKLLSLKARYQARKMAAIKEQPLVFFDEPGLAGFGSSAFITVTPEDINTCFAEAFEAVKAEGGLTGVHVCANTEWSVIFDSGVDVVSYDAYSYFDKLLLFSDALVSFINRGGILATGIVPTDPEFIEAEDCDGLVDKWFGQLEQLEQLGLERERVFSQTLITPSCGTGTASEQQTERVLELTRDVSAAIRARFGK